MNVTLNKTDAVNATISVEVAEADYAEKVENSLKDLRKNAEIPGFRKGMAPASFFHQRYGKAILIEEINKLVSKSLTDYIKDNKLELLGEPLPEENQAAIDFDNQKDFVFTFDAGLSPAIDIKLTKDDRMPYYLISVTDEMIDKQIEEFKNRFGSHEPADDLEENDLAKGHLVELDENQQPKENGIVVESAILITKYFKSEEEKAKFLNAKLHSTIVFNPHAAYEGDEAELASFLNIKKEEANNHTGDFSYEINEINRYKAAEVNQKLFDEVFEPATVDSEEAFRAKIKENLALQMAPESDYKFILDARKLLEEKASDLQFPEAFLKRWLLTSDSKYTPELLEEEFPRILSDLKFHLIKEHLIEENGITIEESELQEYAKRATRSRLAQVGYINLDDDLITHLSQDMLKKKESYRALGDKVFEDKLIKVLKEQVTLEPQEISVEEFQKLIINNTNL